MICADRSVNLEVDDSKLSGSPGSSRLVGGGPVARRLVNASSVTDPAETMQALLYGPIAFPWEQ